MAKKSRTSKRLADNRSGNLFPDLPLPEERLDLVEVRGGIRPVWTEQKAKLIARYLKLFTFVTKHGTYIDGFAGRQSDDAVDGWAAELVLGNEPRWLRRFYLCDNGRPQLDALRELKNRQPAPKRKSESRIVEIIDGDFNKTVRDILDTRKLDRATFCLLDQRTFECKWATVEALAKYRTSPTKIELFYFLPIGWSDRAIHATTKNLDEINTWWGGSDWQGYVDLSGHEKALLFKKRFETLGYKYVWPFPIWDNPTSRRIMFYMILASDHPEAPRLMYRAYVRGVHDDKGWDQIELFPQIG